MAKPKTVKFPQNLRVYVAQKDRKGATRGAAETCPVARAVNRRLPQGYTCFVSNPTNCLLEVFKIGQYASLARYKYSQKTYKAIRAYDNNKELKLGHIRLHKV